MVDAQFTVATLERMQLSLRGHQLSANHVHLLRGRKLFRGGLVGFSRRGGLSTDVVERVFVVHLEVGVLEFPGLWGC